MLGLGGEKDIMIGIKYLKCFPKQIHKLPNDSTMRPCSKNSDGSLGVVTGPHPSFSDNWEMGLLERLPIPMKSCRKSPNTSIYI